MNIKKTLIEILLTLIVAVIGGCLYILFIRLISFDMGMIFFGRADNDIVSYIFVYIYNYGIQVIGILTVILFGLSILKKFHPDNLDIKELKHILAEVDLSFFSILTVYYLGLMAAQWIIWFISNILCTYQVNTTPPQSTIAGIDICNYTYVMRTQYASVLGLIFVILFSLINLGLFHSKKWKFNRFIFTTIIPFIIVVAIVIYGYMTMRLEIL